MTIFDAAILGILQGLTEFLPVSSSGHLVLGQDFLGINQPGNSFEIIVHIGTLFSVLIFFRDDINSLLRSSDQKYSMKYILYIIVGTLPAGIIGLVFKDSISLFFDNRLVVGYALVFTSCILFLSFFKKPNNKNITLFFACIIGCSQAIAIIPGVSRSGITICIAILLGLPVKEAARFSFMLAIPIISGAGLLNALDDTHIIEIPIDIGLVGFLSSFFIGFIALKWLLSLLEKGKLYYFGIYCFLVGIFSIFI